MTVVFLLEVLFLQNLILLFLAFYRDILCTALYPQCQHCLAKCSKYMTTNIGSGTDGG